MMYRDIDIFQFARGSIRSIARVDFHRCDSHQGDAVENYGKTMGKPWENHRKTMGKAQNGGFIDG